MTGTARVPIRRTLVAGAARTRLFVLLALLTGLVSMHQLAGAVPGHEHRHAAGHAVSTAGHAVSTAGHAVSTAGHATSTAGHAAGRTVAAAHPAERPVPSVGAIGDPSRGSPPCPPGDAHCPDRPHGHPGQVCQLSSPGSGPAVPTPVLAALPGGPPADPSRLQPGAAHLSAAGTGCGPPSRAELAIWRI